MTQREGTFSYLDDVCAEQLCAGLALSQYEVSYILCWLKEIQLQWLSLRGNVISLKPMLISHETSVLQMLVNVKVNVQTMACGFACNIASQN